MAVVPTGARGQEEAASARTLPADLNAEHVTFPASGPRHSMQRLRPGALPPSAPAAGAAITPPTHPVQPPEPVRTVDFDGYRISWPDDGRSVDFAHLLSAETGIMGAPVGDGSAFTLTAALLEQVCSNNSFHPLDRDRAPLVLFGIRGAHVPTLPSDWVASVGIVTARPDHAATRCVLGVWYRGNRRPASVRVFPGSTVPNAHYMIEQFESAGDHSNLCPAGFHRFTVGQHDTIVGAFRQDIPYPTHRLPAKRSSDPGRRDLSFTNEVTEFSRPHLAGHAKIQRVGNNLHPARSPEAMMKFSSAGCQVVEGDQEREAGIQKPKGAWSEFRSAAGLLDPPTSRQDGSPYDYLLMTGREMLCTSRASAAQQHLLARLRFGSIDPPGAAGANRAVTVRRFQRALVAACREPGPLRTFARDCLNPEDYAQDGKFFGGTMRLVLAWQHVNRGFADGVVDQGMLNSLSLA